MNYVKCFRNPFFILWILTFVYTKCYGDAAYSDATRLFADKLGTNSGYSTTVRPLLNQTTVLEVWVTFDVLAIVEIDAISQKLVLNGVLGLHWIDELVKWNTSDYKHVFIHPEPKQIWRPRMILSNTLGARDLFQDDHAPVTVYWFGLAQWYPGSLFPTSCKLNLYKYPFDVQECYVEMFTMGLFATEVKFTASRSEIGQEFYVKSGEWEIVNTSVQTHVPADNQLPSFRLNLTVKRLPGFFIVNIVIPIVLMSFLNILVFTIPVDSGEKISYGITVLLALTVFMSIVSEQLPRSSDTLPLVTIYLLVLTVLSVCTVIMSIFIVFCHHKEEQETLHKKNVSRFQSVLHKFRLVNRAATNLTHVKVKPTDTTNQTTDLHGTNKKNSEKRDTILNVLGDLKDQGQVGEKQQPPEMLCQSSPNQWKIIGKHIDCVSFVVFTIIWISVTCGFLVEISS